MNVRCSRISIVRLRGKSVALSMIEHDSNLIPWQGPAVLLVDLDAFFASVEQLDHPAWRGKPVIVGGDPKKHGVVSTASYEAREYGVRSAMPSSTAYQLCPHAIWTRGHFSRYRELSSAVMDILFCESPRLRQVSIDEAFLDVSPTRVNREHPVSVARRIQQRVSELGITCSIGLGTSKTIAKIASDMDKPCGLTVVYPGRESDFLSPLPIRTMSGVGERAEETLHLHGIQTLGQLACAPSGLLKEIWGKNASMMRNRCLGLDATPVKNDDEVKSVSNEMTVSEDLVAFEEISAAVDTMAAKVGRRLRKKGLAGHTLVLKMKFSDRSVRSVQRRMDGPEDNEFVFIPLLHRMIDEIWKPGMKVRLVGVGVSGFASCASEQTSLFMPFEMQETDNRAHPHADSEQLNIDASSGKNLANATDKVKNRFGENAVFFGKELHASKKTTGSAAKNPADYK